MLKLKLGMLLTQSNLPGQAKIALMVMLKQMNEQAIKELVRSTWDITQPEKVSKIQSWLKENFGDIIQDEVQKLNP